MSKKKKWVWFVLSLIAVFGAMPVIFSLNIPVSGKIIILAVLFGLWSGLAVYLLADE